MSSTPRRRSLLAAVLAGALLFSVAPSAVAASKLPGESVSPIAWVLDWLARFGEASALDDTHDTSKGKSGADLDPDGTQGPPSVLLLGSGNDGASTQGDGESGADLDPNG